MTGMRSILLILLVAVAGVVDAEGIGLRLCPVADCVAGESRDKRGGIKVLCPRRRGIDDVIPSKAFHADAYDNPVVLLQVRNLSKTRPTEVGDLLGNDWFAEIVVSNKPTRVGLMMTGSYRVRFIRKIPPKESLCLLIGRLSAESMYEFRVGYENDKETLYSNWLKVDAKAGAEARDATAKDAVPKMSVHRLENNIASKNCDHVIYDGERTGTFVDLVVVLANDQNVPIRCAGFHSGAWTVTACHPDGRMTPCRSFKESCASVCDEVYLGAGECLAVPLAVDVSLADYLSLDKIRIEYNFNSCHGEAEVRLGEQGCDRMVDKPESLGNRGESIEI